MKPIRVAVIGAGPAGMYSIERLLDSCGFAVEVDLYDRLPTPWGLVRAGVAPDHPEKKLVADRSFSHLLKNERVRFIGNVEIGQDISAEELAAAYDAVIYAVGASGDVRIGVKGEDLPGCLAAREFVGYYNGHPDYDSLALELSCKRALIIGNGNVALDVARMLTLPISELERTDIADRALAALRRSEIQEVVILGRRGVLQAAFNNPELEELEHLEGVDIVVEGEALPGVDDPVLASSNWEVRRKVETLRRLTARAPSQNHRQIVFYFLGSTVELLGTDRVTHARIARNRHVRDSQGQLQATPTGETSHIETGLVLRAIGYRGTPFPGLPFDHKLGVIRNLEGRILEENGQVRQGAYVTGWIKRGCRGIIGSNRKCAYETVDCLMEDMEASRLARGLMSSPADVMSLLLQRKSDAVSLTGWLAIDRAERDAGRTQQRPRVKFSDSPALLAAATNSA
jgi:ferredoxin--NADP+ reductase